MTGLLKQIRPIIAALAALFLIARSDPAWCSAVSGDVSGDWTLLMNPVTATGNCRVPAGQTLRIRGGVQVRFAPGASLTVEGTLIATGTDTFPISLVPSDADTGPWGGLEIAPSGLASLTHCRVRGGGVAGPGEVTGMIRVLGPSAAGPQLVLTECEITGSASSGIFIDGGSMSSARSHYSSNGGAQPTDAAIHVVTGTATFGVGAEANEIDNGVFAIYNADVEPVHAPGQWWGAASGPQTPNNVPGQGASVSDDVTFDNWITVAPHPRSGDVDRDGIVSVNDVALVLKACGGLTGFDAPTAALGDVVPDHRIDLLDAARLARASAGLAPLP